MFPTAKAPDPLIPNVTSAASLSNHAWIISSLSSRSEVSAKRYKYFIQEAGIISPFVPTELISKSTWVMPVAEDMVAASRVIPS